MREIELGKVNGANVLWDVEHSPNAHVAVIGSSGSGKSVQAQKIICELIKAGETVLVMDTHGTFSDDQIFDVYKELIEENLNVVEVYEAGVPCHLFEPITFADGTVEHRIDTIGAIVDVLGRSLKLGVKQKTALRYAVQSVMDNGTYIEEGFRALGYALEAGGDKVSLEVHERMLPLFEHNVFQDGEGFIINNKINVLRLSKLDLGTQSVVAELVLSHLWRLANAEQFKRKKLFLFIDECQNMDSSSNGPLALMISEGRRMGINLILATQMILQGTTNSVQQRISQCGLILYFKPAANRVGLTARMINASNEMQWSRVLGELQVGEFIASGCLMLANRRITYPIKISSYEDRSGSGTERKNTRGMVFINKGER